MRVTGERGLTARPQHEHPLLVLRQLHRSLPCRTKQLAIAEEEDEAYEVAR